MSRRGRRTGVYAVWSHFFIMSCLRVVVIYIHVTKDGLWFKSVSGVVKTAVDCVCLGATGTMGSLEFYVCPLRQTYLQGSCILDYFGGYSLKVLSMAASVAMPLAMDLSIDIAALSARIVVNNQPDLSLFEDMLLGGHCFYVQYFGRHRAKSAGRRVWSVPNSY